MFPKTILLFFLLLALLPISEGENFATTIISGSWLVNSQTTCFSNLNISTSIIFKINETDKTNKKATLNYYDSDGSPISGECQAKNTDIVSGLITTIFVCDSTSKLFQYVFDNVIIQWDAYSSMYMHMNATQKMTDPQNSNETLNTTCEVTGANVSYYYEDNTWTVTSCSCYPCCYVNSTDFTMNLTNDIKNYPAVQISGTVQGPYCNGTMLNVDQCALNATDINVDEDPPQNTTSVKCLYLGNRQTTQ